MIKWNVFLEDFNHKKIIIWNVFDHYSFYESLKKGLKKYKEKKEFSEYLKREAMYCFWSKCEYEIILSDWPPSNKFKNEKVDVYDQLNLNWDAFIDYILENKEKIK